jgi:hypothetical protein
MLTANCLGAVCSAEMDSERKPSSLYIRWTDFSYGINSGYRAPA